MSENNSAVKATKTIHDMTKERAQCFFLLFVGEE